MEPAYPGVVAHYINLGDYYDRKQLRPLAAEFMARKKRYQACYTRAYQCLRAAKEVRRNGEKECLTTEVLAKVSKRAKGILSREVKRKKGKQGSVKERFLGAISCEGLLYLFDSILTQCKRIYELQEYGGLTHDLLCELKDGIQAAGYDVIVCLSPEDPSRLEHLMVPELSLAFVRTLPHQSLDRRPYRRVRMETMAEKDTIKANRSKLRFANRIAGELMEDGIRELQKAKALHDDMEESYRPYVNFAEVDRVTRQLLEEIKGLT